MTTLHAMLRALQSLDPAGNVAIVGANVFVQTALIVVVALLLSRTVARRSAAARHAVWLAALACCATAAAATAARPQGRLSLVRLPSLAAHDAPGGSTPEPTEPNTPGRAPAAGAARPAMCPSPPSDPGGSGISAGGQPARQRRDASPRATSPLGLPAGRSSWCGLPASCSCSRTWRRAGGG